MNCNMVLQYTCNTKPDQVWNPPPYDHLFDIVTQKAHNDEHSGWFGRNIHPIDTIYPFPQCQFCVFIEQAVTYSRMIH